MTLSLSLCGHIVGLVTQESTADSLRAYSAIRFYVGTFSSPI